MFVTVIKAECDSFQDWFSSQFYFCQILFLSNFLILKLLRKLDWDSMARIFYAPVVDFTWMSYISNDLRKFLVVWTCLKIKW